MPIVAAFQYPGEDIAKYHKVFEVGGAPILEQPQRRTHVRHGTDGSWSVVDVWAEESSIAAFGRDHLPGHRARPRRQALVYPLEGTIVQDATRRTY